MARLMDSRGFKHFKSTYAQQQLSVDLTEGEWKFYVGGPPDAEPLVCMPGASGTAECFFRQLNSLCPKGYRLIACQPPPYFSHMEFISGFDAFLDALKVEKVHLFGVSLGGFLCQLFAGARPTRVISMILCNSFCSTTAFNKNSPLFVPVYQYTPGFYLKNLMLQSFNSGQMEADLADAIDFCVVQMDSLSQPEVASRLTLNCIQNDTVNVRLPGEKITFLDSLDKTARPNSLRDELYEKYPGARQALLKKGGDFPFLAKFEEANLYIEVHLRSVGAVCRPTSLPPPPEDEKRGESGGAAAATTAATASS